MSTDRVGVIGGGLMGAGITEVCARAAMDVVVVEFTKERVSESTERILKSLQRAEARGKLESVDEVMSRIEVVSDLDAVADRTVVIEAIMEDETAKVDLFTLLDRIILDPNAILASNTSSIPIMKLAVNTSRPTNVIGIHFFNPVPVLDLVELVPSLLTTTDTVARARSFVSEQLGKHAIEAPDRAGFVVNALLIPFLLSAIRMLESGLATAEDIDQGLVRGAAHPQGPLALADLIGLDTTRAIAISLYEEFKEPLYSPPPMLTRMVEAGLFGRKTGRGFYTYG